MKLKHFVFTAAIMGLVIVYACNNSEQKTTNKSQNTMLTKEDTIKRGAYLVTMMLCNDCHSPKIFGPKGMGLDSTRLLSGFSGKETPITQASKDAMKEGWILFGPDLTSAVGPWGRSFSANLTSDETGIGNWTEEQFFNVLRKGKYKGMMNNRNLLPPMPWELIGHASDDDLRAIFAYLKSTKPIKNVVPAPIAPNAL